MAKHSAPKRLKREKRDRFLSGMFGGVIAAVAVIVAVIVALLVSPVSAGLRVRDDVPVVVETKNVVQLPDATQTPSPTPTMTPVPATPEPTEAPELGTPRPTNAPISAAEVLFGAQSAKIPTTIVIPTAVPTQTPEPSNVTYTIVDGVNNTDHALGVGQRLAVADSEFDMTVFLGDSLTEALGQYVQNARYSEPNLLGSSKFLALAELSAGAALAPVDEASVHMTYGGDKMTFEAMLARVGAKRVFLMLGMNDLQTYTVDQSVANVVELARRIKETSPEIEVIVQSVTPRAAVSSQSPDNATIFAFDLALYQACVSQGIAFVDTAYALCNDYGALSDSYCSDIGGDGIHLTDAANAIWVEWLYTHLPA